MLVVPGGARERHHDPMRGENLRLVNAFLRQINEKARQRAEALARAQQGAVIISEE